MRYEVVFIYDERIVRIHSMIGYDGIYRDFTNAARNGEFMLLSSENYAVYDNLEKIITDIPFSRSYVQLEDVCRKMNDELLYDQAIKEYTK